MSDRRRNLFILLAVLGLIAASAVVVAHQVDAPRPRPPGRRPARLRGAPDQAAAHRHARGPRPRARHHAQPRRCARRRRAGAAALGREPDRRQPAGRQERRARRRSGRHDGADVLLRLGAERPRRGLQDESRVGQRRPAGDQRALQRRQARLEVPAGDRPQQHHHGALLRLRQAVARAAQRRRAGRGPRSPGAGPRDPEADLEGGDPRGPRRRARAARRGPPRARQADRRDRQLVGHQGQPGARRHGHQEPRAGLPGRQRRSAERHDEVQRQGTQGVRRHDPRDRAARRGQRGDQRRPAGPDERLAPLRDPARQRADHDAVHQLPREPRRDRRPGGRRDLRRLHDHHRAGPRAAAQDRRPAAQARADLALAGVGHARPEGARPGPDRGPRRFRRRGALPAHLLPRARRDRGDRARDLRALLLRPDQADPDHADAAGHRRPDPHDRGGGGREHRHLRARQGGDTQRPLDLGAASRRATRRASRRSSTRTSSRCSSRSSSSSSRPRA